MQRQTTLFQEMTKELKEVIGNQNYNLESAFSKFFMSDAKVDDLPFTCYIIYSRAEDYCLFSLSFPHDRSPDALNEFMEFYQKIPELKAENVTKKYIQEDQKKISSLRDFWDDSLFIRMSFTGVRQHLFPRFAKYLKDHPEFLQEYREYRYGEVSRAVRPIFLSEEVESSKCSVLGETLCAVVRQNSRRRDALIATTTTLDSVGLPDVLISLVKEYLYLIDFKPEYEFDKVDLASLNPSYITLWESQKDVFATDINLNVTLAAAHVLLKFLTHLEGGALAELDPQTRTLYVRHLPIQLRRITISN